MSKVVTVDIGYRPRKHQEFLHKNLKRFNVLVCHRRFGKSVFAIHHTLDRALKCELHNPQYAYVGPNYGQVKRIAWTYLKEAVKNIPGVEINENELRVDIPRKSDRVRIMLMSGENPPSLKGIYLDGCVLDEFQITPPKVWSESIMPALSDRKGWAIIIGTPCGRNHFYDLYNFAINNPESWYHILYKSSETNIIARDELALMKKFYEEQGNIEEYLQEYECSFNGGLVGSYYAGAINQIDKKGQIGPVPHDPALPVYTYWDLGIDDSTAIWFIQFFGPRTQVIRYMEGNGKSIPDWAAEISRFGYHFGEHTLPHDGNARDLSTGQTRRKTLNKLSGVPVRVLKRHRPSDGIDAVRNILPLCWFDQKLCEQGIDALKCYQKDWDDRNGVFRTNPLHNWASHGADAFRTFAMARKPNLLKSSDFPETYDTRYSIYKYGRQ